ncbi:S41 family peptidase [Spongiimicrobium salis]|uniref:S41 family peptidase n=1 Tax=Spongiimicrobium salis TaxID=1667022 RepID=UPI00374D0EE7
MKHITLSSLAILLLFTSSCVSVKKHNARLDVKHAPTQLRKDVDYAYKKLKKLHPRLYQFVSKETLDRKFDSLKKSLNAPMDSKAFYSRIAPVIAEVRQGHISAGFPGKRYTRKERKRLNKLKLDFNDLDFEYVEEAVWISNTIGKDSSLVGSELLSIDGKPIRKLFDTYKKTFSSDGYNTTFQERFIALRLKELYRKHEGYLDSVSLQLRKADSVFVKQYKRYNKDSLLLAERIKDSLPKPEKVKLTKAERKAKKKAFKAKRKYNAKRGYIASRKHYNRNLEFLDSTGQTAYMQIRSWTNGPYKKFYEESFAKIDSAGTRNLILDLRDNTGGRLDEIQDFYGYLVDKEFQFVNPAEVNTRLPYFKGFFSPNENAVGAVIKGLLTPGLVIHNLLKARKKEGKLVFNYRNAKLKKPHEHNFKGKLYVLINGNSFSASSILSSNLHGTGRAVFVGEETGGGYNGTVAGHYKTIQLPNTKVGVRFGLMHIEAPYYDTVKGKGIHADQVITSSAVDKAKGIDREMEWILNDIKQGAAITESK